MTDPGNKLATLADALARQIGLADYDLSLRTSELGYFSLESRRLLIEPPVEQAAIEAARSIGATASRVQTYLANEIALESAAKSIPYSVVSAVEPDSASSPDGLPLVDGPLAAELGPRDILLNEWAASDLGAKIGDRIRVTYYVSRPMGKLETEATTFTLRGVVRMTGLGADRGFAPTYEGITDAKRLSDWKPPFPMDLKKIRQEDEDYWNRYNATPKAFVSLTAGQELWAESEGRFGRYTSIRILPAPGKNLEQTADLFTKELLKGLRPGEMGLTIRPVRAEALEAAQLFFQYYRENANYLERTYDFVERLGIEKVRKETVYAPEAVRQGLLERLRKSKALSKDAWLEREDPVHPTQFVQIQPMETLSL